MGYKKVLFIIGIFVIISGCYLRMELKMTPVKNPTKLLVMIYMDGDCDLEEDCLRAINELESAINNDVTIIVQIDRHPRYTAADHNWAGCRRYLISRDDNDHFITSEIMEEMGEINMGDYRTLENFIQFCENRFLAEFKVLILSNHGTGLFTHKKIGGCCLDETSNDILTISELSNVLGNQSIDLLIFDACYIASTEFLFSLRSIDYIIASEGMGISRTLPYKEMIENASYNPYHFAVDLINKSKTRLPQLPRSFTLFNSSVFNDNFNFTFNNFIKDLKSIPKEELENIRKNVIELYGQEYCIDFINFLD